MNPDDEICYCFHVPLRKLVNFAKREKPIHGSQMTECLGAGTGCGWCIPFLEKIASNPDYTDFENITPDEYASNRTDYHNDKDSKNSFGSAK